MKIFQSIFIAAFVCSKVHAFSTVSHHEFTKVKGLSNNVRVHRYSPSAASAEVTLDAESSVQSYQRKCPFILPKQNVKFDNLPPLPERAVIRAYHYLQRKIVQAGALKSKNPLTKLFAFIFYGTDLLWAGVDKSYYLKRRAMFGPNFISVLSLVLSKYDEEAVAKDSLDARFLTIPQRRGWFLGSTIMDTSTQYFYGRNDKNKKERRSLISFLLRHKKKENERGDKALIPLFVSDPGASMNPSLPHDQPDHNVIRNFAMDNLLGEEKMQAAIQSVNSHEGRHQVRMFAQRVKGTKSADDIAKATEEFLPTFLMWAIFDIPLDKINDKVIADMNASYGNMGFILNLYGPTWVKKLLPGHEKKKQAIREAQDRLANFISKNSRVLQNTNDGEAGLGRQDLIELCHMLFAVAAFRGTQALAITSLSQMPEKFLQSAVTDANPIKMRNAILECARLDTPVTGSHSIIDDEEGLTTKIGGKTMTFPRGTVLFHAMTIANVDENRFGPNPFEFDPDSRDFSKLTSFNSVGESTNPNAPRICPGRHLAVAIVDAMIRAKADAEK